MALAPTPVVLPREEAAWLLRCVSDAAEQLRDSDAVSKAAERITEAAHTLRRHLEAPKQEERFRALVVDDEPDVVLATVSALKRAGFEVTSAPDGVQGLKAIHADRPDIIVLDLMMPGLSGWDVLREIRGANIPTVIMTARACSSDDIVRGLLEGADDYIEKPFVGSELAARLRAVLRRYGRGMGDRSGPAWQIATLSLDGTPADDLRCRPALVNAVIEDCRTPAALLAALERQPWDLLVLEVPPHLSTVDLMQRIEQRTGTHIPTMLITAEQVPANPPIAPLAVVERPAPHLDLWAIVDRMLRDIAEERASQGAAE